MLLCVVIMGFFFFCSSSSLSFIILSLAKVYTLNELFSICRINDEALIYENHHLIWSCHSDSFSRSSHKFATICRTSPYLCFSTGFFSLVIDRFQVLYLAFTIELTLFHWSSNTQCGRSHFFSTTSNRYSVHVILRLQKIDWLKLHFNKYFMAKKKIVTCKKLPFVSFLFSSNKELDFKHIEN